MKDAYASESTPGSFTGGFVEQLFLIKQQISKLQTAIPVRVVAQRGGGVDVVGFVDVQPLVQQLSAGGSPIDAPIVPNVPYFRLQGGANAVIIDPVVGDMGMAAFSSRDISSVKNARQSAPPGSRRQYSFSDAMYFGGFLNAAPTQYIQFTASGIVITSPQAVTINAPTTTVNGDVNITGTLTNSGINLTTHHHSDPQGGNTGGPLS